MAAIETDDNQPVTLSKELERIEGRLDHLDTLLHDIARQVAEIHETVVPHKDALGRAAAMLDPSGGIRRWMGGRNGR